MNNQIRAVGLTILLLFGALMINLVWLQVVNAEKLASNPANTRLLLKEYSLERGAIRSSDGQTLAISEPTPSSALKFLRKYEVGPLFAHVVGYFSVRFGRDALEQSKNEELSGKGGVLTMQDLGDRFLGRGEKGDNLVLSIDSKVQQAARDALGSRKGAVVALDPLNGQVLAMFSSPSFDPNPLSQHSSQGQEQAWKQLQADRNRPMANRATEEVFPPGSTFKLVTAAASLENGKGTDTTYPSAESYKPPQTDREIRNFGGSTCGGDMVEALTVSCNTYFGQLGAELPRGSLEETAENFGFTQVPPLDIRAAASGLPDSGDLNSPAFAAQSALGQFNVRATPLQMALVAAGIANEGKVPVPKLVKQVEDARGAVTEQASTEVWKEAISPSTADTLREMMVTVVKEGTGRAASLPGIDVAGKTGTAQTGPSGNDGLAWFVAFAPATNPRIALAVMVEGAGNSRNETGGRLAAPMAKQVLQAHRTVAGW